MKSIISLIDICELTISHNKFPSDDRARILFMLTEPGILNSTTREDVQILNITKLKDELNHLKMIRGIIFCAVLINSSTHRSQVFKIEINHECRGAAPNLRRTLIRDKYIISDQSIKDKKLPIRNIVDAHLCTKKYFIGFSSKLIFLLAIIGRNLNILNSRLTHNMKIELLLNPSIMLIARRK